MKGYRKHWGDCKAFVGLHVEDLSELGSYVRRALIIIGLSLATWAKGGLKQGKHRQCQNSLVFCRNSNQYHSALCAPKSFIGTSSVIIPLLADTSTLMLIARINVHQEYRYVE